MSMIEHTFATEIEPAIAAATYAGELSWEQAEPLRRIKLVGVCTPDHWIVEPHNPYRLVGNPEEPDGLSLVHRDDPAPDAPPRAGPAP